MEGVRHTLSSFNNEDWVKGKQPSRPSTMAAILGAF
jgi:hypothetical protein